MVHAFSDYDLWKLRSPDDEADMCAIWVTCDVCRARVDPNQAFLSGQRWLCQDCLPDDEMDTADQSESEPPSAIVTDIPF